ncbi:MAG: TetR/AcrR family transcriptional regulator [Thiolinea sp.]
MNQAENQPISEADSNNLVESEILRLAREHPELGQAAVAVRLQRVGLQISASGVRYIWQKYGLETAVKRLQALAAENEGCLEILTTNQRRYLERGLLSTRLAQGEAAEDESANLLESELEPLDRRRIILNAAAELFSTQGFDRTTIRDIAGQAGLLPGSVYHYFSSKEDLYMAVHQEGFRSVMLQLQAAVDEASAPWERLKRAFTVHINGMVGGSAIDRLTGHSLALTGHPRLLDMIRADRDAYEDVIKALITALPLKPSVNRTLLRLQILGAMNWVYVWYHEGKLSPEQIASQMIDMLRLGVENQA